MKLSHVHPKKRSTTNCLYFASANFLNFSKLFSLLALSKNFCCFQQTKYFSEINFASSILYLECFATAWRNFSYPHYESLLSHRCMIGGKCNLRTDSRKCLTIMKFVLLAAATWCSARRQSWWCYDYMKRVFMSDAQWKLKHQHLSECCVVDSFERFITLRHLTLSIDTAINPSCPHRMAATPPITFSSDSVKILFQR